MSPSSLNTSLTQFVNSGNVPGIEAIPHASVLTTGAFLNTLYGQAPPAYVYLWTPRDKRSRWFLTTDLAGMAREANRLAAEDIFFGVGTQAAQRGGSARGKAEHIAGIPGLWTDIDLKSPAHTDPKLPPTIEDALALLKEFPLRPTVIVFTCHGLHAYWLLKEFWTFGSDQERLDAADLSKRLQATIRGKAEAHGWIVDPTADLARVLRVPGSTNCKQPDKPELVKVIHLDDTCRYDPSDFEPYLVEIPALEGRSNGQRSEPAGEYGAPPPIGGILAGCAWCRERQGKAADDPEPIWYAMLGIVGRCEAGEDLAHEWSKTYGGYTWEETDKKLAHALEYGPRTCHYIRYQLGGESLCSKCGAWGKATSPLFFGHSATRTSTSGTTAATVAPATTPPDPLPPADPLSDMANGARLVARHGRDLRYCYQRQKWIVSDTTGGRGHRRFVEDTSGEVERRAKDTARAIYLEAAAAADPEMSKALGKHAVRSQSENRRRDMIASARSEPGIPVAPADLDADPWLLNCLNGTVDLRSGELRPHRRENLLTKLAPVEYDPGARLDLWARFLADATGGDVELVNFLQRAAGYSITGVTSEEKLFFVHGPAAAGKSTFVEAVRAALGDYAATSDFETFLARRDVGGPRPDIARLAGARFVSSIEVDQGKRLAEGLVKMLTGGDTVTARRLYQEAFEFLPAFKLWLAANHAPSVSDEDDAMWRRILRLPFEHIVPEGKRDPAVKATLRDPKLAGPAILAWLVEGCLAWQRQGLGIPPVVKAATEAYRATMDPLAEFLSECCILDPQAWAPAAQLRAVYEAWAKENGETKPLGGKAWGQKLRERGATPGRVRHGTETTRAWMGLRLADTVTQSEAVTSRDVKNSKVNANSSHDGTLLEVVSPDVTEADSVTAPPQLWTGDVPPEEEIPF